MEAGFEGFSPGPWCLFTVFVPVLFKNSRFVIGEQPQAEAER